MLAMWWQAQGLRWWCVKSTGQAVERPGNVLHARWCGGAPTGGCGIELCCGGGEGFMPLVHTAWLTALVLNAALLTVRLRVENSGLGYI